MKVLITGATGFIGNALCQELLEHGHEVTAIIRPDSKKRDKLPKEVNLILLTLEQLSEISGEYDLFYHLAWNGASGIERENYDIQMSNIDYMAKAIRAAKKCGCTKFVGAGSQAEYGIVKDVCYEDSTVPNPFMMYGAAKLAAYHMGKVLAQQLEISFVWPRIYSVYGVGQNEDTLISYLMRTFSKGEIPELTECENMWDFMYITDCVRVLRVLGEVRDANGIYNVSAGQPKKLREFIEKIRDMVASDIKLKFGAKRGDSKKTFYLNPSVQKIDSLDTSIVKVEFTEGILKLKKSSIGEVNR